MSFTSSPAILQPALNMLMRKERQWPKGVRSVATMPRPCANARLAVPAAVFVSFGSTVWFFTGISVRRFAMSPALRSASFSPVWQMS